MNEITPTEVLRESQGTSFTDDGEAITASSNDGEAELHAVIETEQQIAFDRDLGSLSFRISQLEEALRTKDHRIGVLEEIELAVTRQRDREVDKVGACQRAWAYLADALAEEAEKRGWCSEYRDFIDDVNRHVPDCMPKLHMPTQTYNISFTVNANSDWCTDFESIVDSSLQNESFGTCSSYRVRAED